MKKIQKKKKKLPEGFATAVVFLAVIYILLLSAVIHHKSLGSAYSKEKEHSKKQGIAKITDGFEAFEYELDQNLPFRMSLINTHGLIQRLLGHDWISETRVYNDVYKMKNGQLTYAYPKFDVSWAAEQYQGLLSYCREVKTQLLYVQWPYKVNKYDNQLPHNMKDYSNLNCDEFLEKLKEMNADFLDYREVLHESEENYADLFFNTDHHWKMETAFEAYCYLLNFLKRSYGVAFDEKLVDKENYTFQTLPNSFIGSLANRSGTWYAGIDDFTYIYPNFETKFIWEKYDRFETKLMTRRGSFEKTLLFKKSLKNPNKAKPYRDNCYFNGNPALAKIQNEMIEDGKLLCVVDSYSKPVVSFLSLAFHQVDFIDLRDFTKIPLFDYLKENQYDFILVAYSAAAFKKTTCFDFFDFGERENPQID